MADRIIIVKRNCNEGCPKWNVRKDGDGNMIKYCEMTDKKFTDENYNGIPELCPLPKYKG